MVTETARKEQLLDVIASNPTGLYTSQIYKKVNVEGSSDEAIIRKCLFQLAKRNKVSRTRNGRMYCYFPNTSAPLRNTVDSPITDPSLQKVYDVIEKSDGGMTFKAIHKVLKDVLSDITIRSRLKELVDNGKINRVNVWGKGNPYVYFANEVPTTQRRNTSVKSNSTHTNERVVDQIVRINLPDETHEVTLSFAKQLYEELAEIFA